MKIGAIMSRPAVSVARDAPVTAIARLLVDKGVRGLPVVDQAGRVVGVVTESDLIVRNANLHFPRFLQILDARIFLESPRHFEEEMRRMLGTTAADLMSSPAIVVSPEDEIERAATLMVDKRLHVLPVVEQGKLVGMVSQTDIVRLMAEGDQVC